MQTSVIGQDDAVSICNRALECPTHMFFYGYHGSGKSTLAYDFFDSYAKKHDLTLRDPEMFLLLTADQDRGIHTVRAKLADFTKEAPKKRGVRRWVLIDDADTLPEVSQQALRRPMEQHAHLTCFLFIAKSSECLIHALQSRCQPVNFQPINLVEHTDTLLSRVNAKIEDPTIRTWLVSTSLSSAAEFLRMTETITWMSESTPSLKDVKFICSTHDYDKLIPLVRAIAYNHPENLYRLLAELWQNGMSFEDILHAVQQTTDLYFTMPAASQQRLYTFLVTGWSYHAQSRCSFLDLLCCSMDAELLPESI